MPDAKLIATYTGRRKTTGGLRIAFAELGVRDGSSPSFSADLDTVANSRTLILDGSKYAQASAQLLGYSYCRPDGSLVRYLPQEDWDIPGLWASRVARVTGIAWHAKYTKQFGSTNLFSKCAIQVDFMPRPYSIKEPAEIIQTSQGISENVPVVNPPVTSDNEFVRYVEVESSVEGDYLSIPTAGLMKWAEPPGRPDATKTFPGNLGIIACFENYTWRWHQVPDEGLPEGTISDTVGCVNKTDFGDSSIPRLFWKAGTLLLLGASWRRIHSITKWGVLPFWEITYQVKYKKQWHNKLVDYKADPLAFYLVTRDGIYYAPGALPDGKAIYNEREYFDLFDTSAG